ncbi:PD-(D/E)XK nuclease family protein [Acidaminococcus sp.]|uniref:PD-(D/E)XK nuclease family protein n=1 Tax=Acidaminococcus sp. TaxID=1872103 RepID=UPI003D7D9C2B
MSGTLYSLSLGGSMEVPFLEDAKKRSWRETLILVPNRYYKRRIGQRGIASVDSIDKLPRMILRHNNLNDSVQSIRVPAQKRLLEDVLEYFKGRLIYFETLEDRNGFRENLLSLFNEFTRNDLEPAEFVRILSQWNRQGSLHEKDLELASLYQGYCTLMKQRKPELVDLSQLYARAAKVLEEGGVVPWKKCCFMAFYQFSPVQLRLVKALTKACDVDVALFYDARRPGLSAVTEKLHGDLLGAGFTEVKVDQPRDLPTDLAAFDSQWAPGVQWGQPSASIHLGEGSSPESEIRLALTSIKEKLQHGASPDEFALIVRKLDDYQGLIRSFAQYGIPCRLPRVTGMAGQPLPDFLTKLLAVATDRENLAKWKELLGCTLMEQLYGVERAKLEEKYNERYFATADDYRFFLDRNQIIKTKQVVRKGQKGQQDQTVTLDFWTLVDFFQKDHTPRDWQDGLKQQLEEWQLLRTWGELYRTGQSDLLQGKVLGQTVEFVDNTLDDLESSLEQCGEQDDPLEPKKFQTFWKESLQGKTITLEQGAPRGVAVLEAGSVEGVDFPYVYILGLREGLFPAIKRESWLYSDKERAMLNALGLELSLTARDLETDRYFFGSAVALATKELYLSWYRDEEGGASSYIQELKNFYEEDSLPVTVYQDGTETCASKPLLVNLLAEQSELGSKEEGFLLDEVGHGFLKRCRTVTARWEGKSSPWNGQVETETIPDLKPPLHLSASSLDSYLQCPFAMLVERYWKLQPWQERTAWPTPDVVGNLLHQTLATFLGAHLDQSLEGVSEKQLQQELTQIYESVFQKQAGEGKIPQSPLLSHIRQVYGSWLSTWLHQEVGYQKQDRLNLQPHALEWAFGRKGSPWPSLVRKVDGKDVYFSGQIDRIDKNGDTYMVLDYKSGLPPTGGDLVRGKVVQLPLYIEALEKLGKVPRKQILGGGYCALRSGERTGGLWDAAVKEKHPWMARKRPPDLDAVLDVADQSITKVVQGLRQGQFPASPGGTCPAWCPAKDICRISENPNLLEQEEE